jgi:hypothetical protein
MDEYDKKYGIDNSLEAVKDFHRRRVMFAIKDGEVYVAQRGSPDTHAVWFEKLGWITPGNDRLMETVPRGFVIGDELYCYIGYNFGLDEDCETILLSNLKALKDKLDLVPGTKVYGGMIKGSPGEKFKPIKFYGRLGELIQ